MCNTHVEVFTPALNATGRTSIDPAHLITFDGPPQFALLQGPLMLHRFGSERGLWWYGKTVLTEMREEYMEASLSDARASAIDLKMYPRDGLAVSQEWNKLGWISTMNLKKGEDVEAWVGRTAPQPEWETQPDGRLLYGGLVQYLIYDLSKAPASIFSRQTTVSLWQTWGKVISGVRPPK